MVDLFSVVVSTGVQWGVNRLLDSMVECTCGTIHDRSIENTTYSTLHCPVCNRQVNEFLNATPRTVSDRGAISAVGVRQVEFPDWNRTFECHFGIDSINSKAKDIVAEILIGRFGGSTFHKDTMVLSPGSDHASWSDLVFSTPIANFPRKKGPVTVDIRVYNAWGDYLDGHRRVMNYLGGGVRGEYPRWLRPFGEALDRLEASAAAIISPNDR